MHGTISRARRVGNGSGLFAYDEMGRPRPAADLEWVAQIPKVADQDARDLLPQLLPYLGAAEGSRTIRCTAHGRRGVGAAFGVLCRAGIMSSGDTAIGLLNVLNVDVNLTVVLSTMTKNFSAVDLKLGATVDLRAVPMRALDYRLLRVSPK